MKKSKSILLTLLFLLFYLPAYSYPLGLDHKKAYGQIPKIENFKYHSGSIKSGVVTYISYSALEGYESEVQVFFSLNKIHRVLFILGPSGLDSDNCLIEYNKFTRHLNKKYGHFKYKKIIKDPIYYDLVNQSACTPIRMGLLDLVTYWKNKGLSISSTIVGDVEGFYIEIDYVRRSKNKKSNIQKIL